MRLLAVRLYRGQQKLDTYVQTEAGRVVVPLRWMERNATDTPPETWAKTVISEVQQSQTDRDALSLLRKAQRKK